MGSDHDLSAELDAAQRRVQEHPAFRELLELQALRVSLTGVFNQNHLELMQLLDRAAHDSELAIELMQNVREPIVADRFKAQVTQRLHNYVASAKSLVDHVRHLMRGREGPIPEEFEKRKADLLSHPEVPFLGDLRNYTLHRALPFLGTRVSMINENTPEEGLAGEIRLSVASLLEWDRWTAPARAFMVDQRDVVPLMPVVDRHGRMVFELNAWLHHELSLANAPAMDELDELIIQQNMIMTGGDREMAERRARRDFT